MPDKGLSAYDLFNRLPGYIQILACLDHNKGDNCFVKYSSILEVISIDQFTFVYRNQPQARSVPFGHWCTVCNKPARWSIHEAYQICEECDKPYVPEFRRESYPVRWRICQGCDGTSRTI